MNKSSQLPADLSAVPLYFVGIKGTGMSALAELCLRRGAQISGSDTEEQFYTDTVLGELGIPYSEGFLPKNIPANTRYVVYSAAYDPDEHVELLEARRRNIPMIEYTRALGDLSRNVYSTGVAGVHGKTTTTAILGTIVQQLELPGFVLVGSAVTGFQNRATFYGGERFFVAETCEYRRHFLSFHPNQLLITSVDIDHLDYYRDYNDIESAFMEYAMKLPTGGRMVYCSDDPGAAALAAKIGKDRRDLHMIPYGKKASGAFQIVASGIEEGAQWMKIAGWKTPLRVRIPGDHTLLNCAGAVAAAEGIFRELKMDLDENLFEEITKALALFAGSKRRSELLGEQRGILFVDDYGHHPLELRTTLEGFRKFYPERRIVVDFMSHTYSRTAAMLEDFSDSFGAADAVILHKIYASAREKTGGVDGRTLYEKVREKHTEVYYFHEFDKAVVFLEEYLQRGDLFITIGAGDNWKVGRRLFQVFSEDEE